MIIVWSWHCNMIKEIYILVTPSVLLENYFLYFSSKTYVVCTQKNRLNETILLSTQIKCLNWWVRKSLQFYAHTISLSGPMLRVSLVLQDLTVPWSIQVYSRNTDALKRFIQEWTGDIVCLFWFDTSQSTIFSHIGAGLNSWVEPVLSSRYSVLLKDTKQHPWWGSNPQTLNLKSSTLPLSHCITGDMIKPTTPQSRVKHFTIALMVTWLNPQPLDLKSSTLPLSHLTPGDMIKQNVFLKHKYLRNICNAH